MNFTAPVHAALRQRRYSDPAIQDIFNYYSDHYTGVPGAPDLLSLTADDADAVAHLTVFKPEKHTDWAGLVAYCAAKHQKDADSINPFLPNWYSKTDDRPNVWVGDTTDIPPEAKVALNVLIRESSPPLNRSIVELICEPPVDDMDYLQDVVLAMTRVAPLFAWDLGEGDNENFRWAAALCLLGGLSPTVLCVFASCMQHEEAWQYWHKASHEDVAKDVLDAHKISGYPLGLMRCDFKSVLRIFDGLVLQNPNGSLVTPRWIKSLIALHIFKHARFYGGKAPAIFCAYQGQHNRIKLDPDALYQSFSSPDNAKFAKAMCQTLRLPYNQTRNNRTWIEDAVAEVLQMMQPLYLPEAREATLYPEILAGPSVRFAALKERRSSFGWVRPQVAVTGVARLNYESATVEVDAVISGTQLFNIRWPEGTATLGEIANWQQSLPTEVRPERFSSVVSKRLRNWNKMGFPEGADAVLDATVTVDLFRTLLSGSPVGAALTHEFPLVFILPVGSSTDDTTNQGKTSMACIIGEALVPGLGGSVVTATTSTSPPAMRSLAEPLHCYGTAIYDEFIVPDSREHFLAQSGLQTLATGNKVAPGRALENDPGVKLKHPLFFAAKLVKNVKDIQNRMLPLFLDTLTDATRCTPEELAEITGGRASIQARWCHLLWCHQHRTQGTLFSTIPPGSPVWRFPGHLAAGLMFASEAEIGAYFEAAAAQCVDQFSAAEDSGLTENMGMGEKFDPKFYIENCPDWVAKSLAGLKEIRILEFLKQVVECSGARKLYSVLGKKSEKAAAKQMGETLKKLIDKNHIFKLAGINFKYFCVRESAWKPNGPDDNNAAHVVVVPGQLAAAAPVTALIAPV